MLLNESIAQAAERNYQNDLFSNISCSEMLYSILAQVPSCFSWLPIGLKKLKVKGPPGKWTSSRKALKAVNSKAKVGF